jgi:hypothetical protein
MNFKTSMLVSLLALATAVVSGCSSEDGNARADSVSDCKSLCALQPTATASEADCAATTAESRGYPVTSTAACLGINSPEQCQACYVAVGAGAADCVAIAKTCAE